MACGCPVVTSDTSAMPETAGGAAVLANPNDPASIARAIIEAVGPDRDRLRDRGLQRAGQFTWGATAAATLDVYREAAERQRGTGGNEDPRHRRGRVHRLAHLRPAAGPRARRRGARRADPAGPPGRAARRT